MKIRFNTMKKKEPVTNDFIRIEPSPIKHLIILTPYNRDKIYAYGYMSEESRLFIQMIENDYPEPVLCVFDNIPNKVAFEFEETKDKYDYLIKNIYPSYLTFNLPVLDIW